MNFHEFFVYKKKCSIISLIICLNHYSKQIASTEEIIRREKRIKSVHARRTNCHQEKTTPINANVAIVDLTYFGKDGASKKIINKKIQPRKTFSAAF